MKKYVIAERPLPEERELHIYKTLCEDGKWRWIAETNISKYVNKLKKCGWTQTSETTLTIDDTVQSAEFETDFDNPITFRDLSKAKRVFTEEEKQAKIDRLSKVKSN